MFWAWFIPYCVIAVVAFRYAWGWCAWDDGNSLASIMSNSPRVKQSPDWGGGFFPALTFGVFWPVPVCLWLVGKSCQSAGRGVKSIPFPKSRTERLGEAKIEADRKERMRKEHERRAAELDVPVE